MGKEHNRPDRRITKLGLAALSALASLALVTLWAQPASAASDGNDGETPQVLDITQNPDGSTDIQIDQQYPTTDTTQEISDQYGGNENYVSPCTSPGGCRIRVLGSDGTVMRSEHVMCQYNCGGGGGYDYTPAPAPTEPPPKPATPAALTPATVSMFCVGVGWEASWISLSNAANREYESTWEAEWEVQSEGVWRSVSVTVADSRVSVSGGPASDDTVRVRVRGTQRTRVQNSIGWSEWSDWSTVPAWDAVSVRSADCPPPVLPMPTVTACRSAAGIEVQWTIPEGTWREGTGWTIDLNQMPDYTLLPQSIFRSDALPWSDRSVTITGIPDGAEILATVWADDAVSGKTNGYSTIAEDIAAATIEPGCGVPTTLPSAPAVPAPPSAPIPSHPTVVCRDDGSGGVTATASWVGQTDTDSYAEAYQVEWNVDRGGTVTTFIRPSWLHLDEPLADLGIDDGLTANDIVNIRVRAQATARASATNSLGTTWSGWSSFGAWSAWSASSASATCPRPAPVTPPTLPPCPNDPTELAAAYPPGHYEAYHDTNGNGVYDLGEVFTDINRDGTWTADLGGQPTSLCFPPGHQCLPPPDGTGAADVLCLPRGS